MVSRTEYKAGIAAQALPAAPVAVQVQQQPSAFSGVAFFFLLGFIFVATSRILDFTAPSLHLPLVLAVIAAVLTAASEGVFKPFQTTIGKLMGLFTLWFILCIPFSEWRGGSYGALTESLSRSFLVFVMVASSMNTFRRIQALIAVIGTGMVVTMGIALAQNARIDGRLTMALGQYANPNDLAQVMLLGMCFMPIIGIVLKNKFLSVVGYLLMLPFLYSIFLTGSRSALVTLFVITGIIFLVASPAKKVMLIVLIPIMGAGLLAVSDSARLRLKTIFSGDQATTNSGEIAEASTNARVLTLKQSLELTAKNPLFGVGPGVFQAAAADLQHELGGRALWVETHNAYTQVSSETGVPGAIFFCGAVWMVLKGLLRYRSRTARIPALRQVNITLTLLVLGFATFVITSFFSSVAYGMLFWMLIALGLGAIQTAEREVASALRMAPVPLPARPMMPIASPPPQSRGTRVTLSGRIKPARKRS